VAEVARGQISDRPFVRTVYTVAAKRFSGDLRIEHAGATVPGATGSLAERAAALFAIEEGELTLDDGSTVESQASDEPLDPRWLIFHGILDHYTDERLDRELAPLARRPFQIAPDALASLEAYGLDDDDQPWVKRMLEGSRTFDELARLDASVDRRRLSALVYALLATDALELGQPQAGRAGTPRPRTPAPKPAAAKRPVAATARSERVTIDPNESSVGDADELRRTISDRVQLMAKNADHFAMLGLDRTASGAAIRQTYFRLAKMLHPDRVRQLELGELAKPASQVFARVNEAFGVLSDDGKRRTYLAVLDGDAEEPDDPLTEKEMLAILQAEEKFKLGEMALRRSHFSQALQDFQQAIELNPGEGEHYAMAAWARWMDARDKPAVRDQVRKQFRQGIRLSPRNPDVYFYRGKLAVDLGDEEGALYCFDKTLELEPKHEPAFRMKRLVENSIAARSVKGGKQKR